MRLQNILLDGAPALAIVNDANEVLLHTPGGAAPEALHDLARSLLNTPPDVYCDVFGVPVAAVDTTTSPRPLIPSVRYRYADPS